MTVWVSLQAWTHRPIRAMIAKHVYREFALRLPPCGRGSPAPYLDARRTTTTYDVCRPYNLMIIRFYSASCSHADERKALKLSSRLLGCGMRKPCLLVNGNPALEK
jgi:hypothetical protein